MEFEEGLFTTIILIILFLVGAGICHLVGLGMMWIKGKSRRIKQKRLYAGRILSSGGIGK